MECHQEDVTAARIVESIQAANVKSEELFVRKYRQTLVSYLLRLTQDPNRAEDLAHDALIIVLTKIRQDKIREPDKLLTYLIQTAKYCYIGWLRKLDNQIEFKEHLDGVASEMSGLEEPESEQRSEKVVRKLLNSLNVERYRDVLLRQYIYDQSVPEICDALAMTPQCYHRVISRARIRFKKSCSDLHLEEQLA